MKKLSKKAFTLVELIVVITILAILATIAFISLQGESQNAKNSKVLYDVRQLTSAMEINLSKGGDLGNLVLNNRLNENGVNTGSTVSSGAYTLGNLDYGVGYLDFKKLNINGDDFKYDNNGEKREYIYAYVKTPKKLFYEFAGENILLDGKKQAIIKGNYYSRGIDTKGLISEKGYDIGLDNNQILTGSLY